MSGHEWNEHEWLRDPAQRGEGLICRVCGVTEAEADANPDLALCLNWLLPPPPLPALSLPDVKP